MERWTFFGMFMFLGRWRLSFGIESVVLFG